MKFRSWLLPLSFAFAFLPVPVGCAIEADQAPAAVAGKAAPPAAPPAQHAVRLRFVPVKKAADAGNGASGTTLHRGMFGPTNVAAMAHLGLGDTFPVRDEHERHLFDLRLVDGNDQHLVLEVRTKEAKAPVQKIAVVRDQPTDVTVDGAQYEITFPTAEVNPTDKDTTAQAMIIIAQR